MLSCWGIEANALAHYRAGEKSLLSIWPPLVVSDAFIPKEDHSRASMRLIQGHFKNRRKWEALRRIELLDIYIDQDRAPDKTSRVIWISLLCWCASFHLRFWLWKPLLFMETNVNKRDKIHSSPTCQGNSFFFPPHALFLNDSVVYYLWYLSADHRGFHFNSVLTKSSSKSEGDWI